ncbi:helicase-associated domain-containing protein [Paenarthrobacter sp. Z7-10]|uniref:helicase-associated domain-containing protein n=1 Tax=Paenarthrobacter sp. Z7-10 TaxID=2787635 RepID=UPI0022A9D7FB|nr:helicase-associated domain-containing protein [Paenarthrobacter sp. Z7-10]MCZ2402595.1 helicase-associated domain-containing protein [Paenarthrobacter sp. Z7-10]
MSSIRALAAELAARSDKSLRSLFDARPDLITPPVPDFAALAARACARVSVSRALDKLTQPQTQVLEVLHLSTNEDLGHGATAGSLKPQIFGSTIGVLESLLKDLHAMALVYRVPGSTGGKTYLPVSSLKEVIGLHPAGLGRSYLDLVRTQPAIGARLLQCVRALHRSGAGIRDADNEVDAAQAMHSWVAAPGALQELLRTAPENTEVLLARFSGGAMGAVPNAQRSCPLEHGGTNPVDWLLARGLLIPLDDAHVELPSDVALVLRGGVLIPNFSPQPPTALLSSTSAALRSNAALGSVAEVLRLETELLSQVRAQPLVTLRTGGVGVREVRRLAEALRIDQDRTTLLLELAAAASLLQLDVDTSRWLPADDDWLRLPREEQWLRIATSWLHAERVLSLAGQPLPRGAGVINALAAEAHRPDAPLLRGQTLAILAELSEEAGCVTDAGQRATASQTAGRVDAPHLRPDNSTVPVLDAGAVLQRFSWRRPRLARRLRRVLPGFLAEAELLGLTGSGALTPEGLALAHGQPEDALVLLRTSLPRPLAHVLLQADLTAIAPGYLTPELSAELALLAQAEGQGPATIYRFSAASLRRALDAGRNGAQILEFLANHSATGIPQPLSYLVEDTAARHGRLRVGSAASYLQSDDDAMLAELLQAPMLAHLGLSLLAPTVLVAKAESREVAVALREMGLAPAMADAAEAIVRISAPAPSSALPLVPRQALAEADVEAQLAALRSKPSQAPASTEAAPQLGMEVLRKAIRLKKLVSISIVDGSGNQEHQVLVPLSVSGGRVRVYDPHREMERVVSIHRVMDVEMVDAGAD